MNSENASAVELKGVRKRYGAVDVVHGVDLRVGKSEFVVFVGPSGSGKSTLLRMIAGLEDIDAGSIAIEGEQIDHLPPGQRGLAMVFQNYALYPHMTASANMGFGLRNIGVPRGEIEERVGNAARILQIEHLLDRLPSELSGGQRQRVAIGRAIVRHPKVFLFDEPLSNLDAALRVGMRLEIVKLHRALGTAMIYVTHDQVEAMTMADKIVILRDGRIEQIGAPMEVYRRPVNAFVAGFIGTPKMNFLAGELRSLEGKTAVCVADAVVAGLGEIFDLERLAGKSFTVGVRAEALRIADAGQVECTVDVVERLGDRSYAHLRWGEVVLVVEQAGESEIEVGETVKVSLDPAGVHLFDDNGNAVPRLAEA